MKLTTAETKLLNRLKNVRKSTVIGYSVHVALMQQGDEALDYIVQQLRSQAKDNPGQMENAIGRECYKQLNRYGTIHNRTAHCRNRLLNRLPQSLIR